MRIIYTVKRGKFSGEFSVAAETIDDALELAKALGMEPDEQTQEWVKPMPLIERSSDDA